MRVPLTMFGASLKPEMQVLAAEGTFLSMGTTTEMRLASACTSMGWAAIF